MLAQPGENSGLDDAEAESYPDEHFRCWPNPQVLFWIKRTLLNSQVLDLAQKPEGSIAV
jgi:hypothetical protein